jgi:hypothetical protein
MLTSHPNRRASAEGHGQRRRARGVPQARARVRFACPRPRGDDCGARRGKARARRPAQAAPRGIHGRLQPHLGQAQGDVPDDHAGRQR